MAGIELVLLLLAVSAVLRLVARRVGVPHPVLLAIGGLLLALVPGLPRVAIAPDVLFLIFVPPLLYLGARMLSLRDFRHELGAILRLAVGMVLVSTVAVALVAHALDPAFTWAAAFALGAIVAPPDAVAALTVTRTLGGPRALTNILEGEGLLNDATALVMFRIAVAAAVTGTFSLQAAAPALALAGGGGIAIGLAIGVAARWAVRLGASASVPVVTNTFALLTPFASYLAADLLGASGVIAVATTGIYAGRQLPRLLDPETRLQNEAMWSVVSFLLESLIFILIGLELPAVTRALASVPLGTLLREAALITLCVILVRFAWVWPSAYIPRALARRVLHRDTPSYPWRQVLFIGWSGMRGGDSLVIALSLPFVTNAGAPFPARGQIVFITFVVIFVTLVVQGASVGPLLRWLRLRPDRRAGDEEAHARLVAVEAGLRALDDEAVSRSPQFPEVVRYLRRRHRQRARRWAAREQRRFHGRPHDGAHDHTVVAPSHQSGVLDEQRSTEYRRLRSRMIQAEQRAVVTLRDQDVIGDDVLRRIQHDLDLESMLLRTREPVVEPVSEVPSAIEREAPPSRARR
jgi:CPA1 family monovalent cation:H+ antiporter